MIFILLFILSLVIVGIGQPHLSPFLSLIASSCGFAIFWSALLKLSEKKRRFFCASGWFFFVQLVQLSWLASPTYQGIYIYFVYLGLSIWLGLQFGVISLLLPKKAPLPFYRILAIASLWTLMEWGRLHVLCGFAWNPVGLSLTGFPLGAQFAAVTGIFGLSFLVIVINLLGVNFFQTRRSRAFFAYGGCVAFPYLFGGVHIAYHDQEQRGQKSYHVALVQPALLPDEKDLFPGKEERYIHPFIQWRSALDTLKKHVPKELDLVVFPEYAFPFSSHAMVYPLTQMKEILGDTLGDLDRLLKETSLAEKRGEEWFLSNAFLVQALANHYKAEVVIGLEGEEGSNTFNAAFHFMPEGKKILRYEKRVLLPLAEYLPFSFLKPLVARYGISGFFTPGKTAKITTGSYPMSLSVCYEECFPHLMREGRKKGAQLFVNVTNDGWYPHSRLPEQHFIHGRMRAIENGVPLVRACNTGVSAAVDSLGRTVVSLAHEKKGVLFTSLKIHPFSTLYTFWGDFFILGCSLGCLAFFYFARSKCSQRKTQHPCTETF